MNMRCEAMPAFICTAGLGAFPFERSYVRSLETRQACENGVTVPDHFPVRAEGKPGQLLTCCKKRDRKTFVVRLMKH